MALWKFCTSNLGLALTNLGVAHRKFRSQNQMALRILGVATKVGEKGVALKVAEKAAKYLSPLHAPGCM